MDPGPSTVYAIYKFGYVLNLDSSLHIPSLTLLKSLFMSLCESFLQRTSPRPDKDTNLKAWNKSWEDDLRRYDRLVWEGATARLPPEFHKLPQGTPAFRQRETAKETLAALQSQTRDLALMRLATDDFEESSGLCMLLVVSKLFWKHFIGPLRKAWKGIELGAQT